MRTRLLVAILFLFGLMGCSKGNQGAPTLNSAGKHPSGWVVAANGGTHPASYLTSPGQCFECHGKDLTGGISKVSCFSSDRSGVSCHALGPQGHPAGFRLPENHGSRAKAAVGGVNGMAFCKNCHGSDYRGAGSSQKDCIGCHQLTGTSPTTLAPHSPQPWRDGATTHTSTDQSNAAACAQCHTAGANLRAQFRLASYASGAPGCFNNTLCHGAVGHANEARQPWADPANHGAAAKGDPAKGDGLALCKSCHGQDLAGSGAAVSCFSCHATAPHSPQPWRRTITNTTGRIHTDTNTQNAVACAGCHINNQRLRTPVAVSGSPTCFDNSLCHGPTGHNDATLFPVPAQPWNVPVNHGAKAKGSTAIGASGFTYCRNCHGDGSTRYPLFQGGTALTSCMNVLGCHGLLNNAPHPARPWRGTTVSGSTGHSTSDTSNATICAICHTGGANSTRTPQALDVAGSTGCFNATMCHGITGHKDTSVYPAPWADPGNHGRFARSDPSLGGINGLAYCQHCHGTTFSGGNANQSCYPCHGVSAPHPAKANWTLAAGVRSHINAGQGNAAICDDCHNATTKNLSEPYLSRFASSPAGSFNPSASSGCFNAAMCHGDVRKTSNCDACHSTATTNPFKSMAGSVAATNAIVGAHTKHLLAASQTLPFSANVACSECHAVPTSPAISAIHRNGATELSFGTLARTGGLTPTATRDLATGALVCTNTYCHGTSLTGGSNKSPRWNDTAYLNGCSICHGYPPATLRSGAAHTTSTACSSCHPHVNSTNNGFTDPSKHVNGTVEATASHAFPYPGATHSSVGLGFVAACGGCHDTTTAAVAAGSGYPVAAGTPPKCAGCHLTWSNGNCSDCHGGANGQPNGTTFPNRNGDHGTHNAIMANCDYCHFGGGTGAATHGNSNRVAKTVRDVTIAKNPARYTAPDTITLTQNPATGSVTCSGSCHMGAITRTHNDTW